MLTEGTKNICGASITLRKNDDGSIQIERVEVPEVSRRKGIAGAALKALAQEATKQGVALSASICPDKDTKDFAITNGLRRACSAAGFSPLEMDGEIYPNDVEFNAANLPC